MSAPPELPEPEPEPTGLQQVCVVDTSVLVEIKSVVTLSRQWEFLEGLSTLLLDGMIAFPSQVKAEVVRVRYPDAPGAWVACRQGTERHPQPTDEVLAEVLAVAPRLIDPLSETEIADPYVLAMALTIARRLPAAQVVVATKDFADHLPAKSSLASACMLMGVEWWKPEQFFDWAWAEVDWRTLGPELEADGDA